AHGDRRIDAGRKAAARDDTDFTAVRENGGALARRLAALGANADAFARRTILQLTEDARRAREIAGLAAALLDRPLERRFDRAGRLVNVVAVEAEARLEAQRIARTESDGKHVRILQQALGEAHARAVGARDLETVLARVAGARDGVDIAR